ncbi:MAG: CRISPR-associated protein Cmr2 [Nostoc sp. LLA-1]|nr:CRISPR-associated protein Cmr2 [Cyanocohniella sp. LLY]
MSKYTAITFAPVQGFIEKSRKLRDLYGASLILSYLSQQLVKEFHKPPELEVISPASHNLQKGMPNRILIKGDVSKEQAKAILISAWKDILKVCRHWIEEKIPDKYHWEREWTLWGSHTWEIFQGSGVSIQAAMDDLETRKLCRDWSGVNWIGESSSLTGTDAIAFPGLGAETRNPKNMNYGLENDQVKEFYQELARKLDNCPADQEPEGKYIAPNEKLSIPELVKRLITLPEIANLISQARPNNEPLTKLPQTFTEIQRKPTENTPGQCTGWFMGDGDEVGKHLKDLANKNNSDLELEKFSYAMRNWGENFEKTFPEDIGRVVYAGGDDFLGIIYSKNPAKPIKPLQAFDWLMTLNKQWQAHQQGITVSVGFVWVAGSVPQRDVLQHCREAEKVAKSLGRNRVTIRVVFNSGQYVQWTCPWEYLYILNEYQDREKQSNWSHIYQDLSHLESRRTFKIENTNEAYTVQKSALEFFDIYFPGQGKKLLDDKDNKLTRHLVGFSENDDAIDRARATIDWITDLIKVGWHLCSNT